jgi:hypothetical protein
MTAAVAALFMKSERVIVTTRIRASAITGRPWAMPSSSERASSSAAPVSSTAEPDAGGHGLRIPQEKSAMCTRL